MTPLDLLQQHNIDFRQHGDGASNAGMNWVQVDCPSCSPNSGKYRLGVNKHNGAWYCWLCGPQKSTETWAAVLHITNKEAWKLASALPRDAAPAAEAHTGKLILPDGLGPLLKAHRRYLTGRGFDPDVLAEQYGVQGIGPLGGSLAWRLFIPIVLRSEVVSWTTRAIVADAKKRYHAAGEHQEARKGKSLLFAGDMVRGACVVHEGPLDAIRTGPGAVATCGISYSKAQIRLLSEIPRRVICFDSEPKAQERAAELANLLSVYPGTTLIAVLETGKDAGDADAAELAELRTFAGI